MTEAEPVDSSSNETSLLEGIRQIRISLCTQGDAPIDQVIESGMVPLLVGLLKMDNYPELQCEAGWVLTNIASGTQENTQVVIDHGAVPVLVNLLSSPDNSVREQAMWALCNIANNSAQSGELVLSHGALVPLLAQLDTAVDETKRIATWLLSSLCRYNLQPEVKQQALTALARIVIKSDDEDVLADACLALTYLSDGRKYDNKIQDVVDLGICKRLVELLLHPSPSVLVSALRAVGNIAAGDDIQAQSVIGHDMLPNLLSVLSREVNTNITKETCWAISNITGGNLEHKQAVIDAGLIGPLVKLLKTAEFEEVKKEAAWAITNATHGATREQIVYLVNQGCIHPLCDLLLFTDPKVVSECVSALGNILEVGEADKWETFGVNDYAVMIEKAEGFDKIIGLQNHFDDEIYEKCFEILEKYWHADGNGWWKYDIPEHCRSGFYFF